MSPLLADRGAVVVGGSRGIGAAVAHLLAQHGGAVVINGRDADVAQATAEDITAAGGRAVAHPGSPSDQRAAESLAFLGDYGGTGYPAGKGAVNSLTLAIAAELKEHGVRANVVCPGAKTRLSTGLGYVAHISELNRRGLLDEVSMQGSLDVAEPDYAAPTYVYLASDLAKHRTGEIFAASGGFVGLFPKAAPALIGYRDHHDSPPWSLAELSALLDGAVD